MVTYIMHFIIKYIIIIIITYFAFFYYYICNNNILLTISTKVSLIPLLLTKGCRIFLNKDFRKFGVCCAVHHCDN